MKYFLLAMLIALGAIASSSPKQTQQLTAVVVLEGAPLPGLGADIRKPDTCVAYYNMVDKHVHIKVLKGITPDKDGVVGRVLK